MIVASYDNLTINQDIVLDLLHFEDTSTLVRDISRRHNNMSMVGAPVWTELASHKWVLAYDGATEYLEHPAADSTSLNFTNENFTLLAWVNFTGFSADMVMCQGAVDVDGWDWYLFQGGAGTASINLRTNQGGAHTGMGTTGEPLTQGIWHLIATVRTGATCQHYIDGLPVAMLAGSLTDPVSVAGGNKFLVGVQNNEATNHFGGQMCHHRIWSRALAGAEIFDIFKNEHTVYGV